MRVLSHWCPTKVDSIRVVSLFSLSLAFACLHSSSLARLLSESSSLLNRTLVCTQPLRSEHTNRQGETHNTDNKYFHSAHGPLPSLVPAVSVAVSPAFVLFAHSLSFRIHACQSHEVLCFQFHLPSSLHHMHGCQRQLQLLSRHTTPRHLLSQLCLLACN